MTKNIAYSNWSNNNAIQIAKQVDTYAHIGFSKTEAIEFTKVCEENGIQDVEISKLLGLDLQAKSKANPNPLFNEAIEFYNKMNPIDRSDMTYKINTNAQEKLYKMEKAIDDAFIECDAYKDIVIIPRNYYRYYPNFNDKLLKFDIEEIRNTTHKDMQSLDTLKDKINYIIEEANGESEHKTPEKTDFDIEKLAQKHLKMSYEEFSAKYKDELEFCKTVTYADLNSMNETQRMVYSRAKAYATEMLQTTINEAHTTNWDASEKRLAESTKAGDDMQILLDFEMDGITKEGLDKIKSGIMFKALEDTLISEYQGSNPNGVEDVQANKDEKKSKKVIVNGAVIILQPDGSVYDASGRKLK